MKTKFACRLTATVTTAILGLTLALPAGATGTLRFGAGFERIATSASQGNDTVSVGENGIGGELSYQHGSGFYGGAALLRHEADTLTVNGNVYTVDGDPYRVTELDAGYRIPYARTAGKYFGLGYRNTRYEDYDGTDNTLSFFWEKDQQFRYGVVRAGLLSSDDLKMLQVEGKHLWFGGGGPGFGLTWSLGTGSYDDGINTTLFKLGGILMFRAGS